MARRTRPDGRTTLRGRRAALVAAALAVSTVAAAGVTALVRSDADDTGRAAPASTSSGPSPTATTPSASPTPTPTPTPSPTPTSAPPPRAAGALPTVRRFAADDRHALSAAATEASFEDGDDVPVVHLVSDEALALGWAAVPAATATGGAVLLTAGDRLPKATAAALARLRPDEVVVVGPEATISDAVATAAGRYAARVTRVDARTAWGAGTALTRRAFPAASEAWVASGRNPVHLAVAASVAAARRAPLVVVDGRTSTLAATESALLEDLGATSVTVVGGTDDVSAGIEAGLAAVVGRDAVDRVDARDRAALAAEVHSAAWDGATPASVYLANPDRATDAFTGAFLAGRARVPLHWTALYCIPAATRDAALAPTVARVVVMGGERSARSLVTRLERCRSTEDPDSLWVLVNKRNPVSPMSYAPDDLVEVPMPNNNGQTMRKEAAAALARMAAASRAEGAGTLGIDTAFRSYGTQDALYDSRVAQRGRTWTDRWYLRPGYSEHQTGLTVDLLPVGRSNCRINDCIDETPQGVWLARHSWRFGFILRYERGETRTTGVNFEPWHFRYVGTAMARAYRDGGWDTYEEFLGRPAAPGY